MCDYSMMHMKSRAARVGDKLVTKSFGYTSGFVDPADPETAVCVLPGTEIAFEDASLNPVWSRIVDKKSLTVAIFRQINKDQTHIHHDALEYPGGEIRLLTLHAAGLHAIVLQLPAAPKSADEAKEQERITVAA